MLVKKIKNFVCWLCGICSFICSQRRTVEELKITFDQVYNANEYGLFWRIILDKTCVHSGENEAPRRKVTFMACSNANGSHKPKLMLKGKVKYSTAFKSLLVAEQCSRTWPKWLTAFQWWFNLCKHFMPLLQQMDQNVIQTIKTNYKIKS